MSTNIFLDETTDEPPRVVGDKDTKRVMIRAGRASMHLGPDVARKMANEVLAACADLTGRHDREVPVAFEVRP